MYSIFLQIGKYIHLYHIQQNLTLKLLDRCIQIYRQINKDGQIDRYVDRQVDRQIKIGRYIDKDRQIDK